LKRQLSLPVSTMSQWCVSRSRSALVIFALTLWLQPDLWHNFLTVSEVAQEADGV